MHGEKERQAKALFDAVTNERLVRACSLKTDP